MGDWKENAGGEIKLLRDGLQAQWERECDVVQPGVVDAPAEKVVEAIQNL